MIAKGMRITFKKEYQDPGDDGITFVAVSDEEKGRIDVSPSNCADWPIVPTQTVSVGMIELTE